jgi:hypothetical protein
LPRQQQHQQQQALSLQTLPHLAGWPAALQQQQRLQQDQMMHWALTALCWT